MDSFRRALAEEAQELEQEVLGPCEQVFLEAEQVLEGEVQDQVLPEIPPPAMMFPKRF